MNNLALLENTKITQSDVETVTKTPVSRASLAPATFGEMMGFAQMLAKSSFVPKDFIGKPENILVAIQWGMEIGLAPMQALQNIAVINGRPSLWGDAALAVVQNHPAYEWHKEYTEGEGDAMAGVFQIKRRGSEVHTTRFDVADAKRAHLWGKQGPWTQYPNRMLCLRARGFGLRDKFADALKGLITAEEARDYPDPPLMTSDSHGNMHPIPEAPKEPVKVVPAKEKKQPATDKILESVFIDSILPKTTAGGVEYIIVKNQEGEGYFCFKREFFPTADANLGRTVTLGIKIDGKGRKTIISGLEPIEDQLTTQLEQSLALDSSEEDRIPF